MPSLTLNRALLGVNRFSPLQIPGLKLWLAADRISGLTDADPVPTWSDLSGNGNNAAQGTGSLQPVYKTGILNGKPVVRFDGVDDKLITSAFTLSQPVTIVFVANNATNGGYYMDGVGLNVRVITRNVSTTLRQYAGSIADKTVADLGSFRVITAVFSGVSSLIGVDGAEQATSPGAAPATGMTINAPNVGTPSAMDMAECVAYDSALSQANRTKLTRYLGRRYGLVVS